MYDNYSVLMSVYYGEKADNLKESVKSILSQTKITNDFVLVCDGPLTDELNSVIDEFLNSSYKDIFNVIRLEKNSGLGNALNKGIMQCMNELIARMDSDDISSVSRCEEEMDVFNNFNDIGIVGCNIDEFTDKTENSKYRRIVPENTEEIYKYSRKRNPFNHPSVMFKKSLVLGAGCYSEEFHLFEDYHLWIKMFLNGVKGYNIQKILLHMRCDSSQMGRRGGRKYTKTMLEFHRWILSTGWTDKTDFITGAVVHTVITMMPVKIRSTVYHILREKS